MELVVKGNCTKVKNWNQVITTIKRGSWKSKESQRMKTSDKR